jgi:hypothetical protein
MTFKPLPQSVSGNFISDPGCFSPLQKPVSSGTDYPSGFNPIEKNQDQNVFDK